MHTVSLDWITADAEKVVARHARVSTANPDRDQYKGLLRHCCKYGHWSVFEQVNATFEIITSRAISAQIIRHRAFTFQELSQRYSNPFDVVTDLNDKPCEFELRKQAEKNRQSSYDLIDVETASKFRKRIEVLDGQLNSLYHDMLEAGAARECSRNVLPLYTPTKIHMNGTLRSWLHYVGLRAREETQLEHREIAQQVGMVLAIEVPTIIDLVVERAAEDDALSGWLFLRSGVSVLA